MKFRYNIIILGLILLSTLPAFAFESTTVTKLKVGDIVPTGSFRTLSGDITSIQNNAATLISVFTTWCSVCKVELAHLNKDYAEIKEQKLPINMLVINAGEKKRKVKKYVRKRHLNMPVVMDRKLAWVKELGITGTPTVLIVDKNGQLLYQGNELPHNWVQTLVSK
ncbi:TlpA family protein disulfide reductase [bacterium]|nr:TlpA family protein disulfide reductase [bacterium]